MNKSLISAAGSAILAFITPVLPYAAICTILICTDCVTAINLRRRMRRRGMLKANTALFSSHKCGRVLITVFKTYAGLLLAHGIDIVFETGGWCVKFVGSGVCLHQILSILENESTASDNTWAANARKYLADKAMRNIK